MLSLKCICNCYNDSNHPLKMCILRWITWCIHIVYYSIQILKMCTVGLNVYVLAQIDYAQFIYIPTQWMTNLYSLYTLQ